MPLGFTSNGAVPFGLLDHKYVSNYRETSNNGPPKNHTTCVQWTNHSAQITCPDALNIQKVDTSQIQTVDIKLAIQMISDSGQMSKSQPL